MQHVTMLTTTYPSQIVSVSTLELKELILPVANDPSRYASSLPSLNRTKSFID